MLLHKQSVMVSDGAGHRLDDADATFERHLMRAQVIVEGRDVRRNPVMGDSAPSETAREGAEPQPGKWPAVKKATPPGERRVFKGAGTELFQGHE